MRIVLLAGWLGVGGLLLVILVHVNWVMRSMGFNALIDVFRVTADTAERYREFCRQHERKAWRAVDLVLPLKLLWLFGTLALMAVVLLGPRR